MERETGENKMAKMLTSESHVISSRTKSQWTFTLGSIGHLGNFFSVHSPHS